MLTPNHSTVSIRKTQYGKPKPVLKSKAGSILLLSKVARSKKTRCICASVRIHSQCEQMANMEKNCSRNTNVLTSTKVKTQA